MLSYDYVSLKRLEPKKAMPGVEEWQITARLEQSALCRALLHSQVVPLSQEHLERKVAFALFGPPQQLPDPNTNFGTGYETHQLQAVSRTCRKILKHGNIVGFLFVSVYCTRNRRCYPVPVFRLMGDQDVFVDRKCRVYHGWQDYISCNRLPPCLMCYPKDGVYVENVELQFGESPALLARRGPKRILSLLTVATSVASTALGVAAIVTTVSPPVVIAAAVGSLATGAYGLGRSIRVLVDRGRHGQSVGLASREARNSWLGVAGNTLAIALEGVATATRHTGHVLGLTSLTLGASAVKGLELADYLAYLGNKMVTGEEMTPLDGFQLAASVFFFTDSLASVRSVMSAFRLAHSHMTATLSTHDVISTVHSMGRSVTDGRDDQEDLTFWPVGGYSRKRICIIL